MDIYSHFVGGFLLCWVFLPSLPLALLAGLLGALPDILGYLEKVLKDDQMVWNWYTFMHQCKWLWLIPPIGLHCLLDSFTHEPGKRWWIKKERLWAEILYWIILTTVIIFSILVL